MGVLFYKWREGGTLITCAAGMCIPFCWVRGQHNFLAQTFYNWSIVYNVYVKLFPYGLVLAALHVLSLIL